MLIGQSHDQAQASKLKSHPARKEIDDLVQAENETEKLGCGQSRFFSSWRDPALTFDYYS